MDASQVPPMNLPQAEGNNPLAMLNQIAQMRGSMMDPNQSPLAAQRKQALGDTQNAIRTAGSLSPHEELNALGAGLLQGGWNPSEALEKGFGQAQAMHLALAQQKKDREVAAANLGYTDAMDREKTFMEGSGGASGILGMMRSGMVNSRVLSQQVMQIYKTAFSEFAKQGDPDAHMKAMDTAKNYAASLGIDFDPSSILGVNSPPPMNPQASTPQQPQQVPIQGQPQQAPQIGQQPPQMGQGQPMPSTPPPVDTSQGFPPSFQRPGQIPAKVQVVQQLLQEQQQLLQDSIQHGDAQGAASAKQNMAVLMGGLKKMQTPQAPQGALATLPANPEPITPVAAGAPKIDFNKGIQLKRDTAGAEGEQKGYGTFYDKQATTYAENADKATSDSRIMKEVADALNEFEKNGGKPGPLANARQSILAVMQNMGIPLSEEDSSRLTGGQLLNKYNAQLGAAFAKSVNSNRATQFEVQMGAKNSPGLDMYSPASRHMIEFGQANAELAKKQQAEHTEWHDLFPPSKENDPAAFNTYWSMKQQAPTLAAYQKITPEYIADLAKKTGTPPIKIIAEIRSRFNTGGSRGGYLSPSSTAR